MIKHKNYTKTKAHHKTVFFLYNGYDFSKYY